MEPTAAQRAARDRIAAELAQAGFALPGTLTVRSYACGKPACRCHADPPRLHGPYAEWTRKIGGKTVTRRLTPANSTNTSHCSTTRRNSAPCSANCRISPSKSSRQTAPGSKTKNRIHDLPKTWAGPVLVVEAFELAEGVQVPLAEDQHPVDDLGPGGAHPPLRDRVGPRRQLRLMAMIGTGVCG